MITGQIVRQHLKMGDTHVVADTIDYLEARFYFRTDDWNGVTKWVHFANGETVYDISLTDDCIRKEDHLCLTAGTWNVWLHGNRFTDGVVSERITTDVAVLEVLPTGTLDGEPFPEVPASEVERILARLEKLEKNSSAEEPPPKDVNFYDYDGTRLYSYTVAEAASLTELPALPEHDGLTGQGWNWTLDKIKALGRGVDVGATYITDDGKTRIYVTLPEGRTSPMLGCCPDGTVTVDWGDGTEPDVLTGTDVTVPQWTPTHHYAEAGDYVISLTVEGEMGFYGSVNPEEYSALLHHSSAKDGRNRLYLSCINKVEIGTGITKIANHAFSYCHSLKSVTIPVGVTSVGDRGFNTCQSLSALILPDGFQTTDRRFCYLCPSLKIFSMPDGFTELGEYGFYRGYRLERITLPDSFKTWGGNGNQFYECFSLKEVLLNEGLASPSNYCFYNCCSLTAVKIPSSVTSLPTAAFYNCFGVRCYDFTEHTAVPELPNKITFTGIPADCEIRVPEALADEWKAATNWSEYAGQIVGVET